MTIDPSDGSTATDRVIDPAAKAGAGIGNRIVVGLDGSASSMNALRWAQFLAEASGSTIAAITVWRSANSYAWAANGWSVTPNDWHPSADAEKVLQSTLDTVFGAHRPVALRADTVEGNAAYALIQASRGARMLVVGSRGHGGFVGLLMGSVSSACAEHASCPVLVVPEHTAAPPA